jgi:hypothetical protein
MYASHSRCVHFRLENEHSGKHMFVELIAKLPAPEKSMILGQFVGVATRPELRHQGHTRESRTWRRSGKMAKKGDFSGAGSFAIGSVLTPENKRVAIGVKMDILIHFENLLHRQGMG